MPHQRSNKLIWTAHSDAASKSDSDALGARRLWKSNSAQIHLAPGCTIGTGRASQEQHSNPIHAVQLSSATDSCSQLACFPGRWVEEIARPGEAWRRFRVAANLPILRTHYAEIRDLLSWVRQGA